MFMKQPKSTQKLLIKKIDSAFSWFSEKKQFCINFRAMRIRVARDSYLQYNVSHWNARYVCCSSIKKPTVNTHAIDTNWGLPIIVRSLRTCHQLRHVSCYVSKTEAACLARRTVKLSLLRILLVFHQLTGDYKLNTGILVYNQMK